MATFDGATDQQDRADMQRLVDGDDAALNDLMARHKQPLFHYLIRFLQNEDEAADLTQEAFVRVYQHRHKYDPRQRFFTWLYAIATNLGRDRLKWRSRHRQVSLDHPIGHEGREIGDTLPDHRPQPDDATATEERGEIVRAAIASLPEELRAPLILSEYEAMSHAEIGTVLHCSAKAVETRIYRAKAKLRDKLASLQRS